METETFFAYPPISGDRRPLGREGGAIQKRSGGTTRRFGETKNPKGASPVQITLLRLFTASVQTCMCCMFFRL